MAQHLPPKNETRLSLGLGIYLGYVLLLVTVPYGFPPEADLSTAAAKEGYNVVAAHYVVLAWSLVAVLGAATYWRWARRPDSPSTEGISGSTATVKPAGKSGYFLETGFVFMVFVVLYAPPFLARYGPYIEDSLFLNYLLRMHCGLTPYLDFEFIYGPLTLYPAFYWTEIFGYSMSSFYGYLSLLEGLKFAVLIVVLQRYFPSRSKRYAIFVVLLPILFNTLLGLNSNAGLRELGPVLIVLMVTAHARSLWAVTGGAVLLGLQLAYSHEYGVACLAALIGMYGVMAARREGWWVVLSAAILAVGSGVIWFTAARLLMGDAFPAYLTGTEQMLRYFSEGGHALRFYWTIHSLALFGLLTIACVRVGGGLFAKRGRPLNPGDRLILAGVLFALVALRAGLNRSDLWHLIPAFLVLLFALLLSPPTRVFAASLRGSHRLALTLIGIVSVTQLVGIAPTGSFYAAGYLRGLVDVLVLSKPPRPRICCVTRAHGST